MESAEIVAWLLSFALFGLSALVCTLSMGRPQVTVIAARAVPSRREPMISAETVQSPEAAPAVAA